jgi:dTDP-4-dehydrorhamnose 3,5-epimerase
MIDDVIVTPLKIIDLQTGDVMRAMRKNDPGFSGYGEAYFSMIKPMAIKAWKRHTKLTLNIIVPVGEIRFVLFDDRKNSIQQYQQISLSKKNYCRLTVPPMIWVGFQGMSSANSMLLNITDFTHDPNESDRKNIDEILFNWSEY